MGTQIIILNPKEEATFEEDLASDVLEIITVFSARLYGSRSRKNLKIMQKLHQIPHEISQD
jgi:predicted site-specific integrase-resolvase